MKIRKMREGDIGGIVKVIHNVMGPNDAELAFNDISESIQKKAYSAFKIEDFFVVESNNAIVGGGGVWALRHDPYIARLDWFIIDPAYQRKGVGTMLLRHIEKTIAKSSMKIILAETSSGMAYKAAASFWEKNGFQEIAKIPKYWEDGSACLLYMKRLGKKGKNP